MDGYEASFRGAKNVAVVPSRLPRQEIGVPAEKTVVTSMANMSEEAEVFDFDVSLWDNSLVTDISEMFIDADVFDIGSWDTGNLTNMSDMFSGVDSAGFCLPDAFSLRAKLIQKLVWIT